MFVQTHTDIRQYRYPYDIAPIELDRFLSMEVKERLPYLDHSMGDKRPYHYLYAQQFSRETIYSLICLAEMIRVLQKTKTGRIFLKTLLPHKRAVGVFSMPSTRTRESFRTASELLGMDVKIVNLDRSSEVKGESWEDTIDTLSAYYNIMFIRHGGKQMLERAVWAVNQTEKRVPIINAGSGPENFSGAYQHPTQMLLDYYTLDRSFERFGGIAGKTFVFCGDLNARVVRSLLYALRHDKPSKIFLVCPEGRELKEDMVTFLQRRGMDYEYVDSLLDVVLDGDVFYLSRIQNEYDGSEAKPLDERYVLRWDYRDRIKESARVLHALPKRDEIDARYDTYHDPHNRFVYKKYQMSNGVWMRASIFANIFGVVGEIENYYRRECL